VWYSFCDLPGGGGRRAVRGDAGGAMAESFHESIRVGVVFGGSPRVRPVWFIWNGRTVRVQAVTYTWQTREGRALVRHFAVTDGATAYELRYEPEQMGWRLISSELFLRGTADERRSTQIE
jgi:hypothetical protein